MTGGHSARTLRVLFLAQRTSFIDGKVPPHGSGAHVAASLAGLRAHFDVEARLCEEAPPAAVSGAGARYRRFVPELLRGARFDALLILQAGREHARAAQVAREFKPDVVYERSEYLAFTGSRLARSLRVPLVLEVNGLLDRDHRVLYRSLGAPLGRASERWKDRAAASIVVESPGMAEALIGRGVPAAKLVIVPNAVPEWKLAAQPKTAVPGPVVFGWIGHLMPWYREALDLLISVGPSVIAAVPQARFEIVAGGPGLGELAARARNLGLETSFRFQGPVDYEQVPAVLASFDIGVIPAAFDYQFPVKLVEMGAAGLPLIAPRTASIDGLLVAGQEYEPFTPGDPADLARAMIELVNDPARRELLAGGIRAAVAERFTWPVIGRELAAVVERVAGAAARGRH